MITFSELQEDEKNIALIRENDELRSLLLQNKFSENKIQETNKNLTAKHDQLIKNFKNLDKENKEIREKYEILQKDIEDLISKQKEIVKELEKTKENLIIEQNEKVSLLKELQDLKKIKSDKEVNLQDSVETIVKRKSSTENFDKLINSLLISNQKPKPSSSGSSKRRESIKKFLESFSKRENKKKFSISAHQNRNENKKQENYSFNHSQYLNFKINAEENQKISGKIEIF